MKLKVLGNIYCSYLKLENKKVIIVSISNHHDYDYIGSLINYAYDYFA